MPTPLPVATLLDGIELFGLPHALGNLLEGVDRSRLETTGLFLGPGSGYDMLAPRFAHSHQLNVGPFYPLRRPGKPKFDPFYLTNRAWTLRQCLRATRTWVRENRPAILHTHSMHICWLAAHATRGLDVHRVWHCHGAYPALGAIPRRFIRIADKTLHGIIAISRFVADTIPVPLRSRVHVLHNCVPVERLRREALPGEFRRRFGIDAGTPLIGIFGAVVPIKGHAYFVEAAARVVQQYPSARFAIVGGTTDAFAQRGALDELTVQIHQLSLDGHVIQTGFLPDATRYMVDFDIIAMPSISTPNQVGEGFGMVLIEAMAQGVAVISTKCGAPPEIMENDRTGLLVAPRDAAALADAMLALLDDPARRAHLAAAAFQEAPARYDAPVAAARLESIYASVLHG